MKADFENEKSPIEFWFDFSSPYSYLMSEKIDALAAQYGRTVHWYPILLGAIFKVTGAKPLTAVPIKGEYSLRDMRRSARYLGLPYVQPMQFPIASVAAARAYYWLEDHAQALAIPFAQAAFRCYFREGRDITSPATVLDLARNCALPSHQTEELTVALEEATLKQRLREACETAIARGMVGAPFVIVDREPFWGADRLPMIERWLRLGPF